jgi:hypothetical protein
VTEAITPNRLKIKKGQIAFGFFTSFISAILPMMSKIIGTPWGPVIYGALALHDMRDLYNSLSNILEYFYLGFFIPFFLISGTTQLNTVQFLITLIAHMLFWFMAGTAIAYFCKKAEVSMIFLFLILFLLGVFNLALIMFLSGPDPVPVGP